VYWKVLLPARSGKVSFSTQLDLSNALICTEVSHLVYKTSTPIIHLFELRFDLFFPGIWLGFQRCIAVPET
jgi:hypothetical protein